MTMHRYNAFGLTINSELEFPELRLGHGDPDILIRLGHLPTVPSKATRWDEVLVNRFGVFRIINGSEIIADPRPRVDPLVLRVLLMGRVMAFLLRQRGWLSLHACGVVVDGMGVLFVAPSGEGKSTTAAAFCAKGHRVVTDDLAAVRVIVNRSTPRLIGPP